MEELENIKKQFDELMERAEEIVKKNGEKSEDRRWRAKKGETYWLVNSCFEADWDDDAEFDTDFGRWAARNYFKTEEEANKVAQYIKDYLTLKADAKGFEPENISARSNYYYVFWRAEDKRLETFYDGGYLSGTIYFETREDAEASIAKHGDIWKRFLGVEE